LNVSENQSFLTTLRAPLLAAVLASPLLGWSLASAAVGTLGPGQVTAASAPANMTVPVDGRLRGPDFAAQVTAVAWPASVYVQGFDRGASTGDRLVVFTLRMTQPQQDVGPLAQGTAATVSLEVGGSPIPIDLSSIDEGILGSTGSTGSGVETYAAAVPAHLHDVVLSISEDGFAQRFDLWTLRRLPPAPAVLYRDPTASSISEDQPASVAATIENPADGYRSSAEVTLASATLTYFAPDSSGATPDNPAEAFLVVDLTATYPDLPYGQSGSGHFFADLDPLPANRLTFTPTGGSPVTASSAPQVSTTGNPADDDGLFDALYWFTVPATTTGGTIAIGSGELTGIEYTGSVGGSAVPLELTGAASVSLALPTTVAKTSTQSTPPWMGAPLPSTDVASPSSPAVSGRGGFPLWLAGVLVALFALSLVLVQRLIRRQRPVPAFRMNHPLALPPAPVPSQRSAEPRAPTAHVVAPTADSGSNGTNGGDNEFGASVSTAGEPRTLGAPGDLVVRVFGPVEVNGWEEPRERRASLEALCTNLALYSDRPRSLEGVRTSLRPDDDPRGDPTAKTLRNALSLLRQAVGPERLPEASVLGGYQLSGVVTDWGVFQGLAAQARASSGEARCRLLGEALALVRGAPFASASPTHYAWALDSLAREMTVAVVDVAHELATRRLEQGDVPGSVDSARAGLRASPTEYMLLVDLHAAARTSGDPSAVRRVLAEVARAHGPEAAARLEANPVHSGSPVR
jgi:hypothetical protein